MRYGFSREQLDIIELALLHVESIFGRTVVGADDQDLCYDRICAAIKTIRNQHLSQPSSGDQAKSPVHGPGSEGDQLGGPDQ
jgi:hypothetical protein